MDKEIEKLELHIIRLEQAIRQMQRLKSMGMPEEVIEQKTDEYLDEILETRKEIEKLKQELGCWMERKGYESLSQFKGKLNAKEDATPFERTQFMKYYSSHE